MLKWTQETLFFNSEDFFNSLVLDIDLAQKSISYECYIFEPGKLANRIETALEVAAARGVKVQLLVDAIGSPVKFSSPVPFKRFNPGVKWLNSRNHRKVCIIDHEIAYVGGMNVDDAHLHWRDTGVRVVGEPVSILSFAFNWAWSRTWRPLEKSFFPGSPFVRLNIGRLERRRLYLDLLQKMRASKTKIWLTTAYFIPARSLARALRSASKRGVDVQILVPGKSDVFFTKWISYAFYKALLDSGIKIFEYQPSILHAKTTLIDDWAMVGTSNLNHRSLVSDLEVDIVLTHETSKTLIEEKFKEDLSNSQFITHQVLDEKSALVRFLGRMLLVLRAWT